MLSQYKPLQTEQCRFLPLFATPLTIFGVLLHLDRKFGPIRTIFPYPDLQNLNSLMFFPPRPDYM